MKVVVVGAGLSGAVAARLFADAGHDVEVFENRDHIGGNCFDKWDNGILVHQYGPHCFHTNKLEVWQFLHRFSSFRSTAFCVVANTPMGTIPIPFNDLSAEIVGDLSLELIRDLIFVDYSEKQWGILWNQLPRSISCRVPQRRNGKDCRYHLDKWQGVPSKGFTELFNSLLEGIKVHLHCGDDVWRRMARDHLVYTGSIDDFYRHNLGKLEYRSLRFEYSLQPKRKHFQINECNRENPWTRSVDHSHWLDQDVRQTVIAKEFPCEWDGSNTRFYPKPFGDNPSKFLRYWNNAKKEPGVSFIGRLATYKYLDMDDVVAQVLVKIGRYLK